MQKTLKSIGNQTFQDYEIILTDDTPDDAVKNLIETFNFHNRLKYFKNKEKLGSPENWNEAVRRARGEYIKIMHHDDWFVDENSLEKFVKILDDNGDADFGFCPSIVQSAKDEKTRIHDVTPTQLALLKNEPTAIFYGNIIGSPSATIYRREVNIFFDKNLKWLVDIDFYIRILGQNSPFAFYPQPLMVTTTDAEHSVTNDCINHKEVEIFEYLYLFHRIKDDIPSKRMNKYRATLGDPIIRHRIKSLREIRDCGYHAAVPEFIKLLIQLNKFLPPSYRKILHIIMRV